MNSHDQTNSEIEGSATIEDGSQRVVNSGSTVRTNAVGTENGRSLRDHARWLTIALAGVGILAVGGGIAFPDTRDLLFAFGATGLFGAILAYALTLGRFVEAPIAERLYAPLAANGEALGDALDLQPWSHGRYVPADDAESPRLFVPARSSLDRPADGGNTIVTDDGEGVLLETTGAALFQEFERRSSSPSTTDLSVLAMQLAEALTERFELARNATAEVDEDGGFATVEVVDSALGRVDRFDHPIPSFLAAGFVAGLSQPVTIDVDRTEDDDRWLITCRWESP